ncbi:ketoacyl-synthetase C-terminal extension domain-containing protein [Pseudoroseomonas wenyumeiae]
MVNAARRPWQAEGPLRAGVSSFGMGGTNAHVVLEEAPPRAVPDLDNRPQLLLLSARTPTALARIGRALLAQLRRQPDLRLADVAHTLAAGRARLPLRRALVCASVEELATLLETPTPAVRPKAGPPPHLGLVLDGALPPSLARALHAEDDTFRAAADEALAACGLTPDAFQDPLPPAAAFCAGHGLARLLAAWGCRPPPWPPARPGPWPCGPAWKGASPCPRPPRWPVRRVRRLPPQWRRNRRAGSGSTLPHCT